MDFIDSLPNPSARRSQWQQWINYSIMLILWPSNIRIQPSSWPKAFVKLHGVPKSIVSIKDQVFTSKFQQELFQLQRNKQNHSFRYHQQMNGQSKVANSCLENNLRCFTSTQPKKLANWLLGAEYNIIYHTSTKLVPFEAIQGQWGMKWVPLQCKRVENKNQWNGIVHLGHRT